ncbi:MAG: aminofutalosine synthase MqnE [Bdellovibrionales bacterium]|nr:aminofutalosine synthase MqnE [Bdellovibrionales bacterium]
MDLLLSKIKDKLTCGEDLSLQEGCQLFEYPDLLQLGQLANQIRESQHGKITYYNWNLHLNSTNVCEADCLFCSFARLEMGMPQAYTMSIADCERWIEQRYRSGMTELHIVNGLNPNLNFEYYEDLVRMIRARFPALHVKGFTAVEIHYFAEKYGMTYEQVLTRLKDAGLGSLPGGGAEIFSERVRRKICRDKVDASGWLEVHRTAHRLGLKTNCTMLYGTIETVEERVDHLIRLRDLQKESGGFQVFIPLAFHPEGNRMARLAPPTGVDDLRVIAVSRLMLSNVPHIKAYWIMLGIKTAQLAQWFGANDIDGTVTEEKIYHMAGSQSPQALTVEQIQEIIRAAGREPCERNTLYEVLEEGKEAACG